MTIYEKALIVAMELLRKTIDNNTLAVAANTTRGVSDLTEQAQEAKDFVEGGKTKPSATKEEKESATATEQKAKEKIDGKEVKSGTIEKQEKAEAKKLKKEQEREPKSGTDPIKNVLNQVMGRFIGILGPLAILGQILQANISGFQLLGTATKLLATTMAPVLLPIMVLLATAMTAASEILFTEFAPAMETIFGLILAMGIPAIEYFIDGLTVAADLVREFANALNVEDPEAFATDMFAKAIPGGETLLGLFRAGGDEEGKKGVDALADETGGRGRRTTESAMSDVVRSLRLSMSPKAQTSNLESVGRSAQMAALNQDPLEARMLKIQEDMLNRLDRVVENTRRSRGRGGVYDTRGDAVFVRPGTGAAAGGDF